MNSSEIVSINKKKGKNGFSCILQQCMILRHHPLRFNYPSKPFSNTQLIGWYLNHDYHGLLKKNDLQQTIYNLSQNSITSIIFITSVWSFSLIFILKINFQLETETHLISIQPRASVVIFELSNVKLFQIQSCPLDFFLLHHLFTFFNFRMLHLTHVHHRVHALGKQP